MSWGSNEHGQLGDGTTTRRSIPQRVIGLDGVRVKTMSVGYSHAVVLGGLLLDFAKTRCLALDQSPHSCSPLWQTMALCIRGAATAMGNWVTEQQPIAQHQPECMVLKMSMWLM